MANGSSETTTSTKMMVRLAIRIFKAISLGVRCRFAPSTSAIMRSRKVSPGFALILTTIQSERTRVPPVTALRSPPLSRMTGADSPVMADSSTEATPSITSPSPGITSPASTSTRSPLRNSGADTSSTLPKRSGLTSRFAIVVVRARRKVSACALPRPSAIASAKLAKITVNQSQIEDRLIGECCARECRHRLREEQAHEFNGSNNAADLDNEHHRVFDLHTRVQFLERLRNSGADDPWVPDRDSSLAARLPLLDF